jgi:hypothetical protein
MEVAYAEIGNRTRADELIQSLTGTLQSVVGLSRLAIYLASTGDTAGAAEMSRRAAQQAAHFSSDEAQNVLVSVAGALAISGDVDNAISVARSAASDRRVQAAVAEVASVLADGGDIARARALLQELSEAQSADKVLVQLVRATAAADDLSLTFSLLEQIRGDWSRAVARGTVAGLLGDARPDLCKGLLEEAATIARRSSDPARALADTAAAAYSPALMQPARNLLAEAFTFGTWTLLLPALSRVDPATLVELADSYIPTELGGRSIQAELGGQGATGKVQQPARLMGALRRSIARIAARLRNS